MARNYLLKVMALVKNGTRSSTRSFYAKTNAVYIVCLVYSKSSFFFFFTKLRSFLFAIGILSRYLFPRYIAFQNNF